MRVIQCEHGHYYDADKYEECPTCQKKKKTEISNEEQKKQNKELDIKTNLINFDELNECKDATIISQPEQQEMELMSHPHDGKTQVNFGQAVQTAQTVTSIQDTVRPQDDGKTQVGFGGHIMQSEPIVQDPSQERAYHNRHDGPVVAWVVAVDGPHKGESFELYTKKNYIGRNKNVIVNLYLDNTVSRTSPLGIVFNERKNEFKAIINDSDQVVYINDDLLLETTELHENDIITVGQSILLFVPLVTKEKTLKKIYMME